MCRNHYKLWWEYGRTETLPHLTEEERFWSKVEKTSTCWLWKGTQQKAQGGRGVFRPTGPKGQVRPVLAHRWAYEHIVGPIPQGLEIDHLCRNPACVRPDHLEAVTRSENASRAARDIHVSPMTGHRGCAACEAFFAADHYGSFRRSIVDAKMD